MLHGIDAMSLPKSSICEGGSASLRRPKKKTKTSAGVYLQDNARERIEVVKQIAELQDLIQKSNGPGKQFAENELIEAQERLGKLKGEQQRCEQQKLEEDESMSLSNSVAPSQLSAGNLQKARGAFKIHSRDSGVARHPLFYKVVQAMSSSKTPTNEEPTPVEIALSKVPEEGWTSLANSVYALGKEYRKRITESGALKGRETYYSQGLTGCMGKFCALYTLPFQFMHQYPCAAHSSKEDTADIAAFYSPRDDDNVLVGINEVKKDMDDNTKWQLCGYLSAAFKSDLIAPEDRLFVGLTIDKSNIELYGFVWTKKGKDQPILEHSLLSVGALIYEEEVSMLLQCYFFCLTVIGVDEGVRCEEPPNDFCPMIDEEVIKHKPKVFHNTAQDTLYKLFDHGPRTEALRQPNLSVIEVAYGNNRNHTAKVVDDGTCNNVSVLQAPWFEGGHQPSYAEHVALLCDQLQRLHDKCKKHNDVLCQNVVFGGDKEKPTTNLIDFDYAHLRTYPESWNTSFPERHPNSVERMRTNKLHDVYAAIAILCLFFDKEGEGDLYEEFAVGPFVIQDNHAPSHSHTSLDSMSQHPELKDNWKGASAAEVAKWIRSKSDIVPRSEDERNDLVKRVLRQTKSPPPKKTK